jgi:hypothetical protein
MQVARKEVCNLTFIYIPTVGDEPHRHHVLPYSYGLAH